MFFTYLHKKSMHNITNLFKISQRNKPLTYKISTHQRKTNRKYCVLPWKRWCLTPSIRLFYITFTFTMNLSVMGLFTLKGWGKPLNNHSFISFMNMSDSSFWKCVCVYIIWNLQTIKCWRDKFFHSKFFVHLLNLIYIEIED